LYRHLSALVASVRQFSSRYEEKLSEKLDPQKPSDVLSESLPPLDDHDITAVAEGFERLDRRRSALAELERDVDEVRQLARRQGDTITRNERTARDQLAGRITFG
jgi:hypothetical protein